MHMQTLAGRPESLVPAAGVARQTITFVTLVYDYVVMATITAVPTGYNTNL